MWDISILLLLGAGILWGRSNGRYCLSKLLLHIPDSERKKWISSVTASDLISPFVFLPLSISVCTSPSSTSLAPSLALSLSFCLPFISSSHLSVSLYLSFFISVFNLLFSLLSLLLCISLSLLLFLSLLYGPLHPSSSLSSVFVTLLWVTHLLPMFLSSSLCSCLLFPCLLSVLSWSLSLLLSSWCLCISQFWRLHSFSWLAGPHYSSGQSHTCNPSLGILGRLCFTVSIFCSVPSWLVRAYSSPSFCLSPFQPLFVSLF